MNHVPKYAEKTVKVEHDNVVYDINLLTTKTASFIGMEAGQAFKQISSGCFDSNKAYDFCRILLGQATANDADICSEERFDAHFFGKVDDMYLVALLALGENCPKLKPALTSAIQAMKKMA